MLPLFAERKANLFVVLYTRREEKCTYFSVQYISRRASAPSNRCYCSWGGRGPSPTSGRHYQHYLLLVPLHYRSEWRRGFVAVLQHSNDVLCYLRWRQLPTPTGQEKLGPCYKTPTPHPHTGFVSHVARWQLSQL